MRYREFVEALQGELESRLGEAAVTFQKVTKNNEVTKDCFLISESGYDISPAVYIEEYYREFRDGMSLKEAADKIAEADCHWTRAVSVNLKKSEVRYSAV